MKAVLQRVSSASVRIGDEVVGKIGQGLAVLLGVVDGDGVEEMVTIGPFHGDTLQIYKRDGGMYHKIYTYPKPLPFAHAIWGGLLCGRPAAVIGCRGGARELCCFTGSESDGFHCQVIDSGAGAANVLHDTVDGREVLLAANREIGEVALYTAAG